MDLNAVLTFVAVADAGQIQKAAIDLSLTQQAVSKRVAALEADLGVRLFSRTPRGVELTVDGQVFLPHARELLRAEERAGSAVRPGRRALRVDVVSRRVAPAGLVRDFHQAHPKIALDIVTLYGVDAAVAALRAGTLDATFRAVTTPGRELPDDIEAVRIFDEPQDLITGPAHPLADAAAVTPGQLAGHRIWMPGNLPGMEWTAYYDALAAAYGLSIDALGPNFGLEALLETVASSAVATFLSERTPVVWPTGYYLRRIPIRDPTPVYAHALLWRSGNRHPGLAALRRYLDPLRPVPADPAFWTPSWVLPA